MEVSKSKLVKTVFLWWFKRLNRAQYRISAAEDLQPKPGVSDCYNNNNSAPKLCVLNRLLLVLDKATESLIMEHNTSRLKKKKKICVSM